MQVGREKHPPIYGVKDLSVCLSLTLTTIFSRLAEQNGQKAMFRKTFFYRGPGKARVKDPDKVKSLPLFYSQATSESTVHALLPSDT